MGFSRGEVGKASEAGDGAGEGRSAGPGNGGTGGGIGTLRLDVDDASVFCRQVRYVDGHRNDTTTY